MTSFAAFDCATSVRGEKSNKHATNGSILFSCFSTRAEERFDQTFQKFVANHEKKGAKKK